DVARLHDIVFALGADFTGAFGSGFRTSGDKIIEINNLGRDKSTFKISMDDTGSLWRSSAFFYCPSANFFWSCGEIALEAKCIIRRVDHLLQAGFFDAVTFE